MKTLPIIFVIPFVLLTPNLFSQSGWFWQNPIPQGNTLLEIQSVSSEVGYASGIHGTFLKTTSGGSDWYLLPFSKRIDISGLHFINETTGWGAGSLEDSVYLYKTSNGGLNWTKLVEAYAEDISVFFLNEGIGFVGIGTILYKTIDGGLSWNTFLLPDQVNEIFFVDELIGWFSTWSKIYRTTDGGNTWQFTSIDPPCDMSKIKFVNLQIGWAIRTFSVLNSSEGHLFKSTDGGVTWQLQLSTPGLLHECFSDLEIIREMHGWSVSN